MIQGKKLRVIRMLKTKLLNNTITKYSNEERIMLIDRLTKQEENESTTTKTTK